MKTKKVKKIVTVEVYFKWEQNYSIVEQVMCLKCEFGPHIIDGSTPSLHRKWVTSHLSVSLPHGFLGCNPSLGVNCIISPLIQMFPIVCI